MQNSTLGKLLAAMAILIVILMIVSHFLNGSPPNTSAPVPAAQTNLISSPRTAFKPPAFDFPETAPEKLPEPAVSNQTEIPRETIEECLKKRDRDAANLLAAFDVSQDTNYLNEAAARFASDPRVELTVLARNAFPEDRRKWLDWFKISSPSNSLANYLSAEDDFENGKVADAMNELLAAEGKPQFENYGGQSQLNQENLAGCSGKTPLEAGRISLGGFWANNQPLLATLKQLANEIGDLQKQFASAGDTNSVKNLAAAGFGLASQIGSGESGKYAINQLVARAIAARSLDNLDQNVPFDFLGGETPAQVLQELKDQKSQFRQLTADFGAAYPQLTESELSSYIERMKIYGELDAMRWVVQLHPPTAAQTSQQ